MASDGFAGVKGAAGRWENITRPYTADDVERLRPSLPIDHTLAKAGAEKFWKLLHTEDYIPALGALSGNQVCCNSSTSFTTLIL